MRRLKQNQRHGCDYCRTEGRKTPAVWTEQAKNVCDEHKARLESERDDGHRTEADYETWMRL